MITICIQAKNVKQNDGEKSSNKQINKLAKRKHNTNEINICWLEIVCAESRVAQKLKPFCAVSLEINQNNRVASKEVPVRATLILCNNS